MPTNNDPRAEAELLALRILLLLEKQQKEVQELLGNARVIAQSAARDGDGLMPAEPQLFSDMSQRGLANDASVQDPSAVSWMRNNSVHLGVFLLLAVGVASLAIRPLGSEVERLNKSLLDAQQRLAEQRAVTETVKKIEQTEVLALQDKLRANEAALTQNEAALVELQNKFRYATNQIIPQPLPAHSSPILSADDQIQANKEALVHICGDLESVSRAIGNNRAAYVEAAKGLAQNRLALEQTESAIANLRGDRSASATLPDSNWQKYLPGLATSLLKKFPDGNYSEDSSPQFLANLPSENAALVALKARATALLSERTKELTELIQELSKTEADITAVQVQIRTAQEKVAVLRDKTGRQGQ